MRVKTIHSNLLTIKKTPNDHLNGIKYSQFIHPKAMAQLEHQKIICLRNKGTIINANVHPDYIRKLMKQLIPPFLGEIFPSAMISNFKRVGRNLLRTTPQNTLTKTASETTANRIMWLGIRRGIKGSGAISIKISEPISKNIQTKTEGTMLTPLRPTLLNKTVTLPLNCANSKDLDPE
jgi:hypothetical protein